MRVENIGNNELVRLRESTYDSAKMTGEYAVRRAVTDIVLSRLYVFTQRE